MDEEVGVEAEQEAIVEVEDEAEVQNVIIGGAALVRAESGQIQLMNRGNQPNVSFANQCIIGQRIVLTRQKKGRTTTVTMRRKYM